VCKEGDEVRKKGGEIAVVVRNGLGLDLSPLFIAATTKGALSGPHFFTEDLGVCYLK
jgi:hypothetical protein